MSRFVVDQRVGCVSVIDLNFSSVGECMAGKSDSEGTVIMFNGTCTETTEGEKEWAVDRKDIDACNKIADLLNSVSKDSFHAGKHSVISKLESFVTSVR